MSSGDLILLVDDDPDVAEVVRLYLEGRGHAVEVAPTGAAALAALAGLPVDLVLLDLMLPDVETAALLHAVPRGAGGPDVIVITGYPQLESAITALERGAVGYLVKPFDHARLGEMVSRTLERRRMVRENTRLNAEIAERLRETEALLAISSALTSTLDEGEALRRTCRELARLTGADTVSVHLADGAREWLRPVAAYHVPKEHLHALAATPLPLKAQGFYLSLWQGREPVHSDDVAADPRFSDSLFHTFPHRSGLLLPLALDGEVAGAFYLVWWTTRRRFTERELAPLASVCGQVSLLLRNARLFEQTERARRRLATLNEVSRQLAAVHDTAHVLSRIVDEAARLLGADAAVLRLREGDELVVRAQTESADGLRLQARMGAAAGFSGRIVATGEPLVVGDVRAAQPIGGDFAQRLLEAGFGSFLGVPLKTGDRAVGTLNVFGRPARPFPPDEVSLLQAFADQAVLAIDKAALLGQAEAGRNLLTALHRVGTAMQLSWERDQRVEAFIRGAHEVLGFDRVWVMLVTPDGTALELVRTIGEASVPPVRVPLTPEAGVFDQVFRTRQPLAVLTDADLAAAPRLEAGHDRHPHFRTTRFLMWPLAAGERVIGIAVADNKPSRRSIDPATLEPFGLLCHQFAAALEEARLYAEARARELETAKFYEITTELAGSLDLERVLDLIVDRSRELLGCDMSVILRHDEARGGLTILRQRGHDAVLVRDLVLRPGEGASGVAYLERRAVYTRDRLEDPQLHYEPAADTLITSRAPRAYLAVPIMSRDEVYGVLAGAFVDPHDFTDEDIRRLDTLARHAAIALNNSRLYGETRGQRARLGQIFDSTSDGIVLVDASGRALSANRRAAELLSVALPEGADFPAVLSALEARGPDHAAGFAELRGLLAAGTRAGEGDIVLPPALRVLHWVAGVTTDEHGERVGFTLTFHDVTEEREVSQMKSDFISFVTHQLRTPLTGIRWMLDLAAQEEELPETAGEFIGDARMAAQRLIGLVNDLLDISRLESGRLTLSLQETRLGDVTRSVLDELDVLVRGKGHLVSVAGGDTVPPVMADPQWLRQVILNLTSNAIKYTPSGGTIAVHMSARDGAVEWAIDDTGIGIPAEAQRRLFEKFYRADNAATVETEGTGLGLYLVRLIVERLGGRVWCEGGPLGLGTTFRFTLPRMVPLS